MRAFVLSGGANYGAQQVGALEALFERGLIPDMLVGVSAGALNAAWVAAHPTLDGVRELARIWREEAAANFPHVPALRAGFRLISGKDSLLSSEPLRRFLRRWPFADGTFGELRGPRLYTVAARLTDGALRVFGDDPADRLLDGLMSSTAMPPYYPPWTVDGVPYLDGGVISHLPLQVAVARGATDLYALRIGPHPTADGSAPRNMLSIGGQAISLLIDRQVRLEIEAVRREPGVRLRVLHLYLDDDPGLWNFARAADLIAAGRRLADEALDRSDAASG